MIRCDLILTVRHVFAVALLSSLTALFVPGGTAQAQDAGWPSKPIRMIVPFPPGGGSDNIARLVGKALTESFGQPVIVENRPGAAATLGAQFVAKAPPDGYTLLIGNAAVITLTPQLRADRDPVRLVRGGGGA